MSEFRMRPIYDVLLYGTDEVRMGIYQLYLVTAEQLTRLHYSPGSLKAVKRRLKVLVDNGYIQADAIPTKFFKSPYYYTLGPAGAKYLEALEVDTPASWRAEREVDKHALFVEHTLELNDVLIAAALLREADPRYYLESFTHERVFKQRRPFKATVAGQAVAVIPDAYLQFRSLDRPEPLAVLLEHDHGTEERVHFQRKVRAYLALLQAQAYREMFNVTMITVAFTTFKEERRLTQMREWTRQVLSEAHAEKLGGHFLFAAFTRPLTPQAAWLEPRWVYPFDQPAQPMIAA
jgi:hypothetical protein